MNRRVVITGLGAVTPIGIGVEPSWKALCEGKSGIDTISRFDPSGLRTKIAGEVRGFDPLDYIDKKQLRRMDPFIQFAIAATMMALEDAELQIDKENASSVGVIVGTAIGGIVGIERNHTKFMEAGPKKISPLFAVQILSNMASGQVAIQTGAKGFSTCVVTACATGTHAIGDAFKVIQRGDADAMIAGGTEAALTPFVLAGIDNMKATSTRNDEPQKASRPFDKDRDGFISSEGAGILILEDLDHARSRSAKIYAEVAGYGCSNDAYHVTAPEAEGEGALNCMRMALADGGLNPEQIDYINAHGTSTPLNDLTETKAIKKLFGPHAYRLVVSANKSMLGHLWGAAGAVEAIFTTLSFRDGIIPPTINYETPDLQCDLDYTPNKARKMKVGAALSNSFGFGGANGAVAFKKYEGAGGVGIA